MNPSSNYSLKLNQASQVLQVVPANDRAIWIKIGMALKAEFGDQAFTLFDEWSASAQNYEAKAAVAAWKSFSGNMISIGTLFHFARQFGWSKNLVYSKANPFPNKSPIHKQPNTQLIALRLWKESNRDDEYVGSHTYASRKGINWAAGAARGLVNSSLLGDNSDCIIVPIRSITSSKLQGVECINEQGKKQTFGKKTGGALILGNTLNKLDPWYVVEGWASAVSAVFHHGAEVAVCSFGKSGLTKAANLIGDTYNPKEIVILRENDV
jgi:hypothetical protein